MQSTNHKLVNNLALITQKIKSFASQYHRYDDQIRLLAVSKTQSAATIETAYAAGQCDFGENYLQEAVEKIHALSNFDIVWHFIGHIQTNKTRIIAEHFDWVQSIDRLKVAERLSTQRPPNKPDLNVCVQINIDETGNKSGATAEEAQELCTAIAQLPRLKLRGLMAIPEPQSELSLQRTSFAKMKQLFSTLQQDDLLSSMDTLSMGMSNDMEAAIAEGATLLRIGSAIFGERK